LQASGVSNTFASLQGSVTANNLSTSAWFEYGTSVSLGATVGNQSVGSSNNSITYSYTLSGLQSNTTYYYRAVAQNSQGTSYGQVLSFTTQYQQVFNYTQPSVSTNAASHVSQTSVTLNGSVNPNGFDTTYWFEYGYSQSLGQTVGVQSLGSGNGTQYVSRYISGLAANSNYYYRIAAQNAGGTVYGNILSFTTVSDYSSCAYNNCQSSAPTVQTRNTSYIFPNSALVMGSVNPNGSVTNSWFEWGSSTSLGNSSIQQPVGSGNSSLETSYGFSGLQPSTTYYYRTAAQNAYGVERGTILSFNTLQSTTYVPPVTYTPPPVYTPPVVYYPQQPQYVQPVVINQASSASAVTISMTLNTSEMGAGEEVSLVISYRNDTRRALQDMVLHVALPAEVEYRSANIVTSFQTLDRIDFVIGTVQPSSQGAIAIRAHVKDSVSPASALMFNGWLEYRDGSDNPQSVHSFITAPVHAIANTSTTARASAAGLTASVLDSVSWGWLLALLLFLLLITMLFWLFSLTRHPRYPGDGRVMINGDPASRIDPRA